MREQLSVEDVKLNVDILDVIQEYVVLRKSGRNYVGLCPFHSEKTGSFNVNQQEQFFKCFGCGAGGDVFTFLMKITSEPFAVVLKMLHERQENQKSGIQRVREGSIKKDTKKLPDKELHQISTSLAQNLVLLDKHKTHLMSPNRGLSKKEIEIRGYRSFPDKPWQPFSKMKKMNYEGFPGAYLVQAERDGKLHEYWSLPKYPGGGILIPFYNEYGYIVGWQIRLDEIPKKAAIKTDYRDKFSAYIENNEVKVTWLNKIIATFPINELRKNEYKSIITMMGGNEKTTIGQVSITDGNKYLWMTSGNKYKGTEAGNPLPVHVSVPCEWQQKRTPGVLQKVKRAWVTEGPIKSDISSERVGEVFLGAPGIQSWKYCMQIIDNMGIEEIVLAFDMDIADHKKEALRNAIKNFKEELYKLFQIKKCSVALWNKEQHGKGIDDILIRGYYPEVRTLFER